MSRSSLFRWYIYTDAFTSEYMYLSYVTAKLTSAAHEYEPYALALESCESWVGWHVPINRLVFVWPYTARSLSWEHFLPLRCRSHMTHTRARTARAPRVRDAGDTGPVVSLGWSDSAHNSTLHTIFIVFTMTSFQLIFEINHSHYLNRKIGGLFGVFEYLTWYLSSRKNLVLVPRKTKITFIR